MLTGDPFQPSTSQLVEERERCKGAVYRYNNTSNSAVDISRETRDRHFREILMARWTHHSRGNERAVCGHLGGGVHVDTPFMCDYGYNLSIADNVEIGTYCKLLDSGRISIGRNSSIGANVTIDTQRTPTDPKTIKGTRRTAVAAEVHIGENVHIGANCTILAGVSIGSGAIIHPGSVVVRVSGLE
jgi:acetyltransferase-like isoleucine patch superfamily enzyme